MSNTIAEVSQDTLTLETFLNQQPPGAYFTYEDITEATGVKMDTAGKGYLRTAVKRSRHIALVTTIGHGVTIASETNFTQHVGHKLQGIANGAKRIGKLAGDGLQSEWAGDMTPEERAALQRTAAFGNAVELSAKGEARNVALPPVNTTQARIPLPDLT